MAGVSCLKQKGISLSQRRFPVEERGGFFLRKVALASGLERSNLN
jgi:hypothetical protein